MAPVVLLVVVYHRTLREVIQKHIAKLKAQATSPAVPMRSPPALGGTVDPSPLVDTPGNPGNPVQLTIEQAQEIQSASVNGILCLDYFCCCWLLTDIIVCSCRLVTQETTRRFRWRVSTATGSVRPVVMSTGLSGAVATDAPRNVLLEQVPRIVSRASWVLVRPHQQERVHNTNRRREAQMKALAPRLLAKPMPGGRLLRRRGSSEKPSAASKKPS